MVPRIVTTVVLALVAGLHSLGYYVARGQVYRMGSAEMDLPIATLSAMFTSQLAMSMLGILLSIPLCALLGPASGVLVGLACYVVAVGLAAWASSGEGFVLAMVVGGLGVGMYRPALWATLCRPFGPGHETARTAAAVAVYATVNLVALPAPLIGDALAGAVGSGGALVASAAASGLAAFLAIVTLFFTGQADQDDADRARGLALPLIGVAAATVIVGGAGMAAWTVANDFQYGEAMREAARAHEWVWYVNPAVVLITGAVAALSLGGAALSGLRVPTLLVAGGGMVLGALGLVPLDLVGAGVGTVVAVVAVGALGEALMMGPLFAQACGGLHFRLSIVPAAGLVFATTGPALLSQVPRSADDPAWGWVTLVLAGIMLVAGVVLLAGALPAQRVLDTVAGPDYDPLGDPLGAPVDNAPSG